MRTVATLRISIPVFVTMRDNLTGRAEEDFDGKLPREGVFILIQRKTTGLTFNWLVIRRRDDKFVHYTTISKDLEVFLSLDKRGT